MGKSLQRCISLPQKLKTFVKTKFASKVNFLKETLEFQDAI
jgi:hypothetical protein